MAGASAPFCDGCGEQSRPAEGRGAPAGQCAETPLFPARRRTGAKAGGEIGRCGSRGRGGRCRKKRSATPLPGERRGKPDPAAPWAKHVTSATMGCAEVRCMIDGKKRTRGTLGARVVLANTGQPERDGGGPRRSLDRTDGAHESVASGLLLAASRRSGALCQGEKNTNTSSPRSPHEIRTQSSQSPSRPHLAPPPPPPPTPTLVICRTDGQPRECVGL